jgi:hypothetical protein
MSKIVLQPNASGTGNITITTPNTNTDRTLNIPDVAGNFVTTGDSGTVTSAILATNAVRDELPAGSVVQTVHTNGTPASVSTGSVTLQTATITPIYASSKILMITNSNYHMDNAGGAYYRAQYNYSIAGGASGQAILGNNYLADAIGYPNSVYTTGTRMHYGGQKLFPSYNTTSAITFTLVVTLQSGSGALGCGYNHNNDMTLMEIKQ